MVLSQNLKHTTTEFRCKYYNLLRKILWSNVQPIYLTCPLCNLLFKQIITHYHVWYFVTKLSYYHTSHLQNKPRRLSKNSSFYYRASYALEVYAIARCLSVSVSVTSRCSTKMSKHRNTQTTPHDSPGTLVFWCQKISWNSNGVTPNGGAKCRWGRSKLANFDK